MKKNARLPRLASGVPTSGMRQWGFAARAAAVRNITKEGYDVSEVFPWYRSGLTANLTSPYVLPANTTIPIVSSNAFFGSMGESAFKNDTDGVVEIERLSFSTFLIADSNNDVLSRVQVKIELETEDYIKKWLPITSLHTDPRHYVHGELNQGTWVLPTPYFLQAGHVFKGRIFAPQTATLSEKELTIALRGYNPVDFDPIVMATTTTFPVWTTATFSPFVFTENRDGPLRDMVIEEITVGLSNAYDELSTAGHFLNQVFIQFEPPDGPKWSQDVLVSMSNLTTQMNVTSATNYFPMVVHEPVSPIKLEPGQAISMWIRSLEAFQSGLIGITASGIQRGRKEL